MGRRQTILGFFDNATEAQQAVQLLLAQGFTGETVGLSTLPDPNAAPSEGPVALIKTDTSSGRFFSTLFGSLDEVQPGVVRWCTNGGTLVTVHSQSAAKTKQVIDLLDTAGAEEVTVEGGIDLGPGAVGNGAAAES